jgi:hypothetical protein
VLPVVPHGWDLRLVAAPRAYGCALARSLSELPVQRDGYDDFCRKWRRGAKAIVTLQGADAARGCVAPGSEIRAA